MIQISNSQIQSIHFHPAWGKSNVPTMEEAIEWVMNKTSLATILIKGDPNLVRQACQELPKGKAIFIVGRDEGKVFTLKTVCLHEVATLVEDFGLKIEILDIPELALADMAIMSSPKSALN